MNFIITRFLRMINRDYGFDYTLTRNYKDTCTCYISGIPEELKNILISKKYSYVSGLREIKDKSGNTINIVCDGIFNPSTGVHGIRILFDDSNYANKVNVLDYELRRYYENNSRIGEINNKV